MKRFLLFALFTTALTGWVNAQSYLGISKYGFSGPGDTISGLDSINYSFYIKNYGPDNYGTPNQFRGIEIHFDHRDTTASPGSVIYVDTTSLYLPSGDSALFRSYQNGTTAPYKAGINIIVIWPVTNDPSWLVKDSIIDEFIYIPSTNGTAEVNIAELINVYPNPAADEVQLSRIANIKALVMYDLKGRIVERYAVQPSIYLNHLPKGIYMLHINMNNNQTITWRIVKE